MSGIIVIRNYMPGDEINCKELCKAGLMSSMSSTFLGILFKEITFQSMVLCAAIMFIFFGLPLSSCLLVIPIVTLSMYVGTYVSFTAKAFQVTEEIARVPRVFMSNAFSCFWVAEVFEPYLQTKVPHQMSYTILSEQQFRESHIDSSSRCKRIVGTIGLCKSHTFDKGAWIKRLCVHENYQRKGIGSCLLNTAVQFAIDQGYSSANIVASEYTVAGRELCLKKGFELKQMYHKPVLGTFITITMYELSYQIKSGGDDYLPDNYKDFILKHAMSQNIR